MPHRDIVFFLGAGFSADADLPVMSKFTDAAKRERSDIRKYTASDPPGRVMAPEFESVALTYESFCDACVESGAITRDAAGNIETVFCIAEALRAVKHTSFVVGPAQRGIDTIVAHIELWIWKVYHQLPFFNTANREPKPETYNRFFKSFTESGIVDRTTIVTTNYDIVFEWMSAESGLIPVYPASHSRINVGTGGSQFIGLAPSQSNTIPLYKLHGSINYFLAEPDSDDILVAGNLSDGKPIGKSGLKAGLPAVVAFDALADLRTSTSNNLLRPAIVPPTYAKAISSTWQREIWSAAFDALRNAKALIFVGYSLPRTDGFMEALLTGALAARTQGPKPLVFAVDGDPTVRCRLRRLYGDEAVQDTKVAWLDEAADRVLPGVLERLASLPKG